MLDQLARTAVNVACPWSGKPVSPDSLTTYRDHVVGFCNPGCRDKFEAATRLFDAAVAAATAGPTLFQMAGAPAAPPSLAAATLVVIDAQEEYRDGPLRLDGFEEALDRIAALLAAARRAGAPVIHIVHRGTAGGLFDPATTRAAICPEVAPLDGEPVVEKTLPDAFAGTTLETGVRDRGRPWLLLAGFMTHNCVDATARTALNLRLRVAVAGDATATRGLPDPLGGPALTAAELRRTALAGLADRTAHVFRVDEIVAASHG